MLEKVLVANRGECACRILKTLYKLNIPSVALYSEADINSKHLQMASEAVLLNGSLSSETYLNVRRIIYACKKTGAKYLHPGWGFLSENYRFVELLNKEGISFIGPSSESMKLLGDKIKSKEIANEVGVNVIPGDLTVITDIEIAKKVANKIGYPIILKASAGGGGKGIRIVYEEKNLKDALNNVKNEAKNSFGDDRIFMEKYIENPRHIEVQVIADKYGNIVCLGERECSIQRNNQKIIEESPSSFIDDETRNRMYEQVIKLCKRVNYYSVGTVEFMVDKNKNFYFLEMNTRIQVEHGITELVTGLDLVELMIRIEKGEKLPFTQNDIKINGWALECRINSEDPNRNFLPSSGRIVKYIEPKQNENVRIDSGIYEGYYVSMYYDSMLLKLLTHAKTREEAITQMKSSLSELYIEGVANNVILLEKILSNENFNKGEINTSFLKNEFSNESYNLNNEEEYEDIFIGVSLYIFVSNVKRLYNFTENTINKTRIGDKWVVELNNSKYLCNVSNNENNNQLIINYGKGFSFVETSWQFGDNIFRGYINGNNINVKILKDNKTGDIQLQYMGVISNISIRNTRTSELEQYMLKIEKSKDIKNIKSPITGKITKIFVKEGDKVQKKNNLLTIEAMKMENVITSEIDTKIKKVNFKEGDFVNVGDVIIEFEIKKS